MKTKPKHYKFIHIATDLLSLQLEGITDGNVKVEIQTPYFNVTLYKFFVPMSSVKGRFIDQSIIRARLKHDYNVTFGSNSGGCL